MEGGERHADFDYPDEQWVYFKFADRFGWTPETIDNLPAATADWLLAIDGMIDSMRAQD